MKAPISPYELIREADDMMKRMILDFPKQKEEKVLMLINSAETYPNMSAYQIMQSRITLVDLYISHGIHGNAYDLCKKMLEINPKAPVKKKIKNIEATMTGGRDNLTYSCDINIVDGSLCYSDTRTKCDGYLEVQYMHNPDETSRMISDTVENYTRTQRYHSNSADALNELRRKTMEELRIKAEEDDNIYDEEFEKMLEERLSKLDELSRSEFYRLRTHRKNNGVLSAREIDLLTLEAMEKSYNYRKDK